MQHKLPLVSSSQIGDLSDPAQPIIAHRVTVDLPHKISPHCHQRGQLIYASSGSLQIKSLGPIFMVPSQFAAWIPPGIVHSVTAHMPIDYCSLFVDATASHILPHFAQLLHLTTLFKELTYAAANNNIGDACTNAHLSTVILDQIKTLEPARVALPIPGRIRMHKLITHFLTNPSDNIDLSFWSNQLSMSKRSITRQFKNETGLTFGQWLQHLKVLKAIELLESGTSIKTTSFEVGYRQSSPFIAMFKRVTGQTPTEYLTDIS